MLFEHIDYLDEQFQLQKDYFIGVRDGKIAYLGKTRPEGDWGESYAGAHRLLMPGFVNAHSHSPMTLLRGYAENLALADWLNTRVFPFESKLTDEAIHHGALLAAAEMLRFGVTSATDMYFGGQAICEAFLKAGLKINLSIAPTCSDQTDLWDLPEYREAREIYAEYHGAGEGRIKIDMSIHAEYTSTPKVVGQMAEAVKGLGARMHVHLSETKAEQEACKERHGKTPARYFYDLGLFDVPATAAHCVWIEGEDFDILKEKGVTVANCPVSNLKLASGFCPVPRLLEKGINVGIGTDGAASNNSLNMLEEVKLFGILYKGVTGDPTVVTPAQALYAATRGGACSQGREDCGLVKEGFKADLIVIDTDRPYLHPRHDLACNLVYAGQGSDVTLTMVDGRVLYRDGEYTTLDYEKVVRDAEQSTSAILAQL